MRMTGRSVKSPSIHSIGSYMRRNVSVGGRSTSGARRAASAGSPPAGCLASVVSAAGSRDSSPPLTNP